MECWRLENSCENMGGGCMGWSGLGWGICEELFLMKRGVVGGERDGFGVGWNWNGCAS